MGDTTDQGDYADRTGQDLTRGLATLRNSSAFQGPVEPLDDHDHANDHFALIYENCGDQFAAAIPFIKQGLESGEQCLYIAHDNSKADIVDAIRDYGIDVDAALDSGALSVVTAQDSYLRDGMFDPDDMLSFLADQIDEATGEFEALRVTGEMTWALDDSLDIDDVREYERKLNHLHQDTDIVGLCQYNCKRFPPEVIKEVIRTHPYLIYDSTVSHNTYYTPPEELFASDEVANEVDRMIGTLYNQTRTQIRLQEHHRYLRECYEITSNTDRSFQEKVQALLELGCDYFGLEIGCLTHLEPSDGDFRVEVSVGSNGGPPEGLLPVQPGEGYFCREAVTMDKPTGASDVRDLGWDEDEVYEEFGFECYLGIKVTDGTDPYGTLWFANTSSRGTPFTDAERTLLDLMGQWVSYELERRHAEEQLREKNEQLKADLTATQQLQETSTSLIPEDDFEALYKEVIDAGVTIMDADCASMQLLEADRGKLKLLAHQGFTPEAAERWELVDIEEGTTCAKTLETGHRTIASDIETCEFMAGTKDLETYRQLGIAAVQSTPLISRDGEVLGVISTHWNEPHEPSERDLHLLDVLARQAADLIERIQSEEELKETAEKLEAQNERLENFASMLAHELRNPVTIGQIYGSQLPAEEAPDVNPVTIGQIYGSQLPAEEAPDAVEYVTEAFDRIEDMIDVLLVLARGREAVGDRTPMDLAAVAQEVWDEMETHEATVAVDIDAEVEADETYIRHLFQNLFENAVEHGGPDVTVTVGNLPTGFYVADDGTGLPSDERKSVFEPGYTTASEQGGTGLGLAFVRELADVYDWDCSVTENADGGARFKFENVTQISRVAE